MLSPIDLAAGDALRTASIPATRGAGAFAEILARLWRGGMTGRLEIWAGTVRTCIYMRGGAPVFADGGSEEDSLGRLLVRQGKITAQQYAEAACQVEPNPSDIRFGELLVQLGTLYAEEVFLHLKLQVRERILACFDQPSVSYVFECGDEHLHGVQIIDRPAVGALLVQGIARAFDGARTDAALRQVLGKYPVLEESRGDIARRYELPPSEQVLIRALTGQKTVREVIAEAPMHPIKAGHILAALILGGALQLRDKKSEQPTGRHSLAPRAIVERNRAPRVRVTRAPEDYAPDLSNLRVLSRLRAAPQDDKTQRVAVPEHVRRMVEDQAQAEVLAIQGKQALRAGRLSVALAAFSEAAARHPEQLEHALFAAWTAYRLAAGTDEAPARARVRHIALELINGADPPSMAYFVLGHFFEREGNRASARLYLAKALGHDPEEARRRQADLMAFV